jgi:hypothetical protein
MSTAAWAEPDEEEEEGEDDEVVVVATVEEEAVDDTTLEDDEEVVELDEVDPRPAACWYWARLAGFRRVGVLATINCFVV